MQDLIRHFQAIDANVAAKQYMVKNLIKIKAVITNPDLPPDIRKPAIPSTDAAVLNVTARLCSSTPVRNALPAAMKEVKSELGVGSDDLRPGKKKRLRAKDYESNDEESSAEGSEDATGAAAKLRNALGFGAERPSSDEEDLNDDEASDDETDDANQYHSRLAFSDSDDDEDADGDEDEDIEEIERRLAAEGIGRRKSGNLRANDIMDSDLSATDDESEAEIPVPRRVAAPTKSSFVPSLTMGGYISGSGSDIDDAAALEPPRKNRRGQRARQQIWEKKFGGKAKHLLKSAANARWDPKRGATDRNSRGGRSSGGRGGFGSRTTEKRTGANDIAIAKRPSETKKPKRDDTGPLHPSWEAAKRAKEKKSVPVAFQGKKISFD